MIDIKLLRENPDKLRENISRKKQPDKLNTLNEILELDEKWRKLNVRKDKFRAERNQISADISKLKKEGKKTDEELKLAARIPEKIEDVESEQKVIKERINSLLRQIPNIMHESVPEGKDDSENVEIKKWGKPRKFGFPVKNHVEILENLGLVDFDSSAETSGNGFYFLKGALGLLNQAIIRFALDNMEKNGYTYIEPPLLLRKKALDAALDTEAFENTIYSIKDEDLCLIGTSEHSLLAMHSGKIFTEQEMPKKYFSYSMCFRKEIGSHGINEKGLWRTHQFNKVEQFIFCLPEDSYKYYDELLENTEKMFQALEIPYRLIECCTGDLATWKAKSSDIEAWRPTTEDYGELTSLTNCTAFQAQDLGIKVDRKNGEREVVHTLNNTAIATSRMLVAILENFQNKDGTVDIPKVLQPYMNGMKKLKKI